MCRAEVAFPFSPVGTSFFPISSSSSSHPLTPLTLYCRSYFSHRTSVSKYKSSIVNYESKISLLTESLSRMSNHTWATNCQAVLNSSLHAAVASSSALEEHDYMGVSDRLKTPLKSGSSTVMENLGDTDLRLGLGPPEPTISLKPEVPSSFARFQGFKEPPLPPLPSKESVSVNKRVEPPSSSVPVAEAEATPAPACPENISGVKRGYMETLFTGSSRGMKNLLEPLAENSSRQGNHALPQKAQVVGWPPIGPFRKSALPPSRAPTAETNDSQGCSLYVKVNMDGVPVGRKVDLKAYNGYQGLSHALKDMFQLSATTTTTGGSSEISFERAGGNGAENSEKSFKFLPGLSLTYEDKDGDWMLVGDVPWSMFVSAVRRLRIMKESESSATG